ncbi:(d)CMP kinase [Caldicellulosiruptoraceae bacterium PP1]
MKLINISIDGPAGAGKSTISKLLAEKLGYIHIDTGAMYRAVGLKVLQKGIKSYDRENIINILNETKIDIRIIDNQQTILLDGIDVSAKIRDNQISMYASDVSKIKEVREKLVSIQQEIAKRKGIVMDGRDIGTCVIPDAELKIFLTASVEERAKRRFIELTQKGIEVDYLKILDEIKQRDLNDTTREISPLKKAEDAIVIDSTNLSIDEVLEKIYSLFIKVINNEI